jgi:non-heme chloroperoxidase
MIKTLFWIAVLVTFSATSACAQDISGDWQGTLDAVQGPLRAILKISKADDGDWNAMFYSIDRQRDDDGGMRVTSLALQGSTVKFTIDAINGSYEGKLSADGASIAGYWTQNNGPRKLNFERATKETAWPTDASHHMVQFITVETGVKLEVLDWGGSGRPLVMLAGLGNTAHIFDTFAEKLAATYHVYGITRRGFGASSSPAPTEENYSADRLGDDVLAVIDALKLSRPVLVGHSIAGEELSSIGSRHPEKVAGLIYLDAGYAYAYYDASRGDVLLDSLDLKRKLEQLISGARTRPPLDPRQLVEELLQTNLPRYEKDLQEWQKELPAEPPPPAEKAGPRKGPQGPNPGSAIMGGEEKYTEIKCPALAIFAVPHDLGLVLMDDPKARAAEEADELARMTAIANAFEAGVPSAHVVRLPHASHYVFVSNEGDVLREMKSFLLSLQ